ncbi:MAG: hypothetical protein J5985_09070 [Kiritimatiellae bacterium]|nr:hypothetical protein [Kiritimatiellia bacterium]
MAGASLDSEPGRPSLPHLSRSFELPPGMAVAEVVCERVSADSLVLPAPLPWGQPSVLPGETVFCERDETVYTADAFYPVSSLRNWRTDFAGERGTLSVEILPVRVHHVAKRLEAARRLRLRVSLVPRGSGRRLFAEPPSRLPPGVTNEYVVVAPQTLASTPAPWNLDALLARREADGFRTNLVTAEWIDANYAGTNRALRVRAFARDAYLHAGLKFLLIVGTYAEMPSLPLHSEYSTFLKTYREDIPSDAISFGCLDGTLDGNGNGVYGEVGEGENGDIDLTSEVMVGRFPVADAAELAHLVRKTLRYQEASAETLRRNGFMAETVNFGSLVYASGFMDALRFGISVDGLDSVGFETTAYSNTFTSCTLYDSDEFNWNTDDAFAFLNGGYAAVNHLGHGTANQCMKISLAIAANRAKLAALTNDLPYFAYSSACLAGALDRPDCFAEQLVTAENAAVAAVMGARETWFYSGRIAGDNFNLQRAFWDAALTGKATRFGEMNEASRRANLAFISPKYYTSQRWAYLEMNLFGDPALPFARAVNLTPPSLEHTPLLNTFETEEPYSVECRVEPVGIFDPATVRLVWTSDAAPNAHTQWMARAYGNCYTSSIPAQPVYTRVAYRLLADNAAGVTGAFPSDGGDCTFRVTPRLSFNVLGAPAPYGEVTPDYGTTHSASGLTIQVSAPRYVPLSENGRMRFDGFVGGGSVPATGGEPACAFTIREDSFLVWRWKRQNKLVQTATNGLFAPAEFWCDEDTECLPPAAPEVVTDVAGDEWRFAEWRLDDTRFPAAPSLSAPQAQPVPMNVAHRLAALYLPETEDADGNGICDWYEWRYYGCMGLAASLDTDGDGYTLAEEFADRTDPLDAASIPAPPVIDFEPLEMIQRRPGPYTVRARITDTRGVERAVLRWRSGGGVWQETELVPEGGGVYAASFGETTFPAEDFDYQLEAADPNGFTTVTETCFLFTVYPEGDFSRLTNLVFHAYVDDPPLAWTNRVVNRGNETLAGTVVLARQECVEADGLKNVSLASIGQPWNIATNRFFSSPCSLHAVLDTTFASNQPVRATMTLAPCRIGKNARLSFRHWICSETDSDDPSRAFDGGMVEYSLDGGATFTQLPGPYTHTIYGWQRSPWTNGVPCFAGHETNAWREVVFDLAEVLPEHDGLFGEEVVFRFHYGGDDNHDEEGWYVDDIRVYPLFQEKGFGSSAGTPAAFSVEPGRYRVFDGYNLPALTEADDTTVSVLLLSNDPYQPFYTFDWRLFLDYPETAITTFAGDGTLAFPTHSGYRYTVEATPTLCPASWRPLDGVTPVDGTGLPAQILLPMTNAPSQFFRLRITR